MFANKKPTLLTKMLLLNLVCSMLFISVNAFSQRRGPVLVDPPGYANTLKFKARGLYIQSYDRSATIVKVKKEIAAQNGRVLQGLKLKEVSVNFQKLGGYGHGGYGHGGMGAKGIKLLINGYEANAIKSISSGRRAGITKVTFQLLGSRYSSSRQQNIIGQDIGKIEVLVKGKKLVKGVSVVVQKLRRTRSGGYGRGGVVVTRPGRRGGRH